jgi:hypothetical protein
MQVIYLSSGTQQTADLVRAAQESGDSALVLWGAFCQLGRELGGQGAAMSWLRELVATTGRPLAFSTPSCELAAETHIFTPSDWNEERTLGWLGGLHEEVEAVVGPTNVLHERSDGSRVRLT